MHKKREGAKYSLAWYLKSRDCELLMNVHIYRMGAGAARAGRARLARDVNADRLRKADHRLYQELIEPAKPARERVASAYRSTNGEIQTFRYGGRMLKVVLPVYIWSFGLISRVG